MSQKGAQYRAQDRFVVGLLDFALRNKIFRFAGSHFLSGVGRGYGHLLCALVRQPVPGGWEDQLFSNEGLVIYFCHILLWHRYTGDILIWDGDRSLFDQFMTHLNSNTWNLQFNMSCHQLEVPFFGHYCNKKHQWVSLLLCSTGPQRAILSFHASSAHPTPLIYSIPYRPFRRLKFNSKDSEVFEEEARKLQTWLLARGYSKMSKAYNHTEL